MFSKFIQKRREKIKSYSKTRRIITIVALLQLLLLIMYATYSWVETASTLEIFGDNLKTDKAPYSGVQFYNKTDKGSINLRDYFDNVASVHLQPASSADGSNMFFETTKTGAGAKTTNKEFRKGDQNDVNVNYVSFEAHVMAMDSSVAIGFDSLPSISISDKYGNTVTNGERALRIAISDGSNTKIFAADTSASQGTNPISNLSGSTVSTSSSVSLCSFADYLNSADDSQSIFTLPQNMDTTISVTIWLEGQDAACTDSLAGCTANVDFTLAANSALSSTKISFFDATPDAKFSYNNVYFSTDKKSYFPMSLSDKGEYVYDLIGVSVDTIYFRGVIDGSGCYEWTASGRDGNIYYTVTN